MNANPKALVFESSGVEVTVGATVRTFRGEAVTVVSIEAPRHSGSTGRVYVCPEGEAGRDQGQGFYPGVIGAEWSHVLVRDGVIYVLWNGQERSAEAFESEGMDGNMSINALQAIMDRIATLREVLDSQ